MCYWQHVPPLLRLAVQPRVPILNLISQTAETAPPGFGLCVGCERRGATGDTAGEVRMRREADRGSCATEGWACGWRNAEAGD